MLLEIRKLQQLIKNYMHKLLYFFQDKKILNCYTNLIRDLKDNLTGTKPTQKVITQVKNLN